MNTQTSTATMAISATKLFVATMLMFGAGSVALATVPLSSFYSGAVDPDAKSTFDVNQLYTKATTKYNGGSKTDYCYTFPKTGKTYLMEGISRSGNFSTWQKNCAELNLGKTGVNYQCLDGACVNTVVTTTQSNLIVTKNPNSPVQVVGGIDSTLGEFDFTASSDVKVNSITLISNTDLSKIKDWKLMVDGVIISNVVPRASSSLTFENLNFTIVKGSTKVVNVFVDTSNYNSSSTFQIGVSAVNAYDIVTANNIVVPNLPVWANVVLIEPALPDFAFVGTPAYSNGNLNITVMNAGTKPLNFSSGQEVDNIIFLNASGQAISQQPQRAGSLGYTLAPGEKRSTNMPVSLPSNTVKLRILLDSAGLVKESNETNNELFVEIPLQSGSLKVVKDSTSPLKAVAGTKVILAKFILLASVEDITISKVNFTVKPLTNMVENWKLVSDNIQLGDVLPSSNYSSGSLEFFLQTPLTVQAGTVKLLLLYGDTVNYAASSPQSLMMAVSSVDATGAASGNNIIVAGLPVWSNTVSLGSITNL